MRPAVNVAVVVLMLLLCGGLLIPAIAKVRDASYRINCVKNLRCVGMAIQGYHEIYERFPAATARGTTLPPEQRLSWLLVVLPYIESQRVYSRMALDQPWDAEGNLFAASLSCGVFQCPRVFSPRSSAPYFPTTYLGLTGLGADAAELPVEDARAGFFGYDRTLGLKEVGGRASTLLAVAETSKLSGAWTAGGSPTARGLLPESSPYVGEDGQFGGLHQQSMVALYVDGSVRPFRDTIPQKVYEALVTLSASRDEVKDFEAR